MLEEVFRWPIQYNQQRWGLDVQLIAWPNMVIVSDIGSPLAGHSPVPLIDPNQPPLVHWQLVRT